jgi:hypothetical protein
LIRVKQVVEAVGKEHRGRLSGDLKQVSRLIHGDPLRQALGLLVPECSEREIRASLMSPFDVCDRLAMAYQ